MQPPDEMGFGANRGYGGRPRRHADFQMRNLRAACRGFRLRARGGLASLLG